MPGDRLPLAIGVGGEIQRLRTFQRFDDGANLLLATGVRFLVSMQFNRFGDLFATDQEGATWGPGNPLDKLIQILPGRHYGFPPRDPQYLPDAGDGSAGEGGVVCDFFEYLPCGLPPGRTKYFNGVT